MGGSQSPDDGGSMKIAGGGESLGRWGVRGSYRSEDGEEWGMWETKEGEEQEGDKRRSRRKGRRHVYPFFNLLPW